VEWTKREIRRVRYRAVKKVARKAVSVAKNMAFDRLYHRLGTKEREKEVFKLARARERKTRDLGVVRIQKSMRDDEGTFPNSLIGK